MNPDTAFKYSKDDWPDTYNSGHYFLPENRKLWPNAGKVAGQLTRQPEIRTANQTICVSRDNFLEISSES
jgi:hypothetical protein